MDQATSFDFSADGTWMVCGDGPEVLVYSGADCSPRWKEFTEGLLVGVVATREHVVTVDTGGQLVFWRALDGRREERIDIGAEPRALSVVGDGPVVVVTDRGLHLADAAGSVRLLPFGGASTASFGPDANSVGVGTLTGVFAAVDTSTGASWGSVQLGAPVFGVAWSALGVWVVAAGSQLFLVSGDGAQVTASLPAQDAAVRGVACTAEGVFAATVAGGTEVVVFDLDAHSALGSISLRREIGQIAFGLGATLGIGLDDGDANRVDLFTGAALRTEPHTGRGRNTWQVKVGVDVAAVRGAATRVKAGGDPIARYVGPKPDSERSWLRTCLGCALAMFVSVMVCSGCIGLSYLARFAGLF